MAKKPSAVEHIVALVAKLSKDELDALWPRLVSKGEPYEKQFAMIVEFALRKGNEIPKKKWDELGRHIFAVQDATKNMVEALKVTQLEVNAINLAIAKRNRRSDPATVQRNIAICDEKKKNPSLTCGQLAKTHDISRQAVSEILKDEAKWRAMTTNKSVDTISKNGVN